MSVSSGSDVTIPIQDSPPPPPSPYGNRNPVPSAPRQSSETPEPRGDMGASSSSGVVNNAYQSTENQTNGNGPKSLNKCSSGSRSPGKKNHTEITMNGHSEKTSGPNEAVNPELINMNVLDTIPQKPQPEFGPFENFDEYFISVNQHKKFLRRGEKLYVTKDKRKTTNWKKYICWLIGAFVLASIVTVAILAAVGLIPATSSPTQVTSVELVGMTSTESPDMTISSSSDFSTSERQQSTSPTPTDGFFSSSSTQSPVFDNHVPSAAELQLTLVNAEFEEDLSNMTSEKFVRLSVEVEQNMKQTLEDDLKLETAYVRVTGFSPGSVVAKMRIGWIDSTKKFQDVQRFVPTIKKIGEYDIRPGTTSYQLYNFCKANNNGCSNYCTFDYESLDFLCTCPEYLLLAEDKKTCQEISSPPPSPTPSAAAPDNTSASETIPEEVPTNKPEEIPEETTEPQVIPQDSSPSPVPSETPQLTPEPEPTNSSQTSEETPITPVQILPNATSEAEPEEDPIVATTNMPDVDYNVEVNPELTAGQGNHSLSTEKFAQILVSEPSIIPIEPAAGNASEPGMTIEEIISHPTVITLDEDSTSTTTTTTTTTAVPIAIESIEETTMATSVEHVDDQAQFDSVIHPSSDLASTPATTTTTTTTEIPPPIVDVVETSANSTTSEEREYDGQPSVENSESEIILQNGSNTDMNRTSRLIVESSVSQSQSEGDESQESPVTSSSSSEEFSENQQSETGIVQQPDNKEKDLEIITTTTPAPEVVVSENQGGNGQQSRMVIVTPEDREREALAGEVIAPENNSQQEVVEVVPQISTLFTNASEPIGHLNLTAFSTSDEVESILPASGEVDVSPTNVPAQKPRPRPHPGSDEFMAFSDANMSIINALNNKKPNTTATSTATPIAEQPSSASVEAASYEVVSGDESEISSASGSHSLEEMPLHREIEEVTTIIPISLINDTAVNNLTEHVTEDLVNTEIIFPPASASEETILAPVTENTGSRETEHGETSDGTIVPAVNATIDFRQQNPIEQSKPEVITPAPTSQEVLTTTPFPPTSAEHVFSTTIPILPNLNDNNNSELFSTSTATSTTTTTNPADLVSSPTINATTTTTSPPQFSVDNENELQ